MVQVEGKNEFHVETKALSLRTDDLGQVLIPTNILADARAQYQWLCTARTPEGRLAHLGFAPIWGGRYHDPAYDQVKVYTITDRPVYRPGQPVRFKFWVAHARYDQPDASDFAHKTFTVEIQNPEGREGTDQELRVRRLRRFRWVFRAAFGRGPWSLPGSCHKPRRRLVPGRGVQEARVRGERRGSHQAGDAGREGAGDDQGEVLFRFSSRRGQGQVQGHADDGRRTLVSRGPMGLALRAGLLVVRRRLLVVSRLVALGHRPARALVVESPSKPARSRGRGRGADPARWHVSHRDRHGAGQGDSSRCRTSVTRSRPR